MRERFPRGLQRYFEYLKPFPDWSTYVFLFFLFFPFCLCYFWFLFFFPELRYFPPGNSFFLSVCACVLPFDWLFCPLKWEFSSFFSFCIQLSLIQFDVRFFFREDKRGIPFLPSLPNIPWILTTEGDVISAFGTADKPEFRVPSRLF